MVGTGIRLCLAKESVSNEEVRLGAVGAVFALRRRVFGGKEKGVEGTGGSTGRQQDLSRGSVGQGRCEEGNVRGKCQSVGRYLMGTVFWEGENRNETAASLRVRYLLPD